PSIRPVASDCPYGAGQLFCATGPPAYVPRLVRRIVTGDELSSNVAPSATSFVVRKSRMLGICVAALAASRENSVRKVIWKLESLGRSCTTWLSACGAWNAASAVQGTAWIVSGVNGGALTYGDAPLAFAKKSANPTLEPPPPPDPLPPPDGLPRSKRVSSAKYPAHWL